MTQLLDPLFEEVVEMFGVMKILLEPLGGHSPALLEVLGHSAAIFGPERVKELLKFREFALEPFPLQREQPPVIIEAGFKSIDIKSHDRGDTR